MGTKKRETTRARWKRAQHVWGTAERPRLVVSRGLRSIQGQFVNDEDRVVICGATTLAKSLAIGARGVAAANALGKVLAERAKEKGISKIVFDRNGYPYHGRVKALADGAREGGLVF